GEQAIGFGHYLADVGEIDGHGEGSSGRLVGPRFRWKLSGASIKKGRNVTHPPSSRQALPDE
ncbi:hypothetical protein OZH69_25465, partial [Escherichia coli]|uniref:hypothetical protein n=1 Tax=Escherichia coli TaxID=562 RepID=UPI002283A6B4